MGEVRRHPAFALETTNKGNANEIAGLVVTPVVVDAGEVVGVAAEVTYQKRAAVRTPIDECVENPVAAAVNHNRGVADEGRSIIAGFGNLRFEPREVPYRAAEYSLLLEAINFVIDEDRIGNAAEVFGRPSQVPRRVHQMPLLRPRF
jgi:hypothetical protein